MNRITRHQMWMEMAGVAAKRSTCYRGNVGAIIVSPDHKVVSVGYNGPPSGDPHCTGLSCERTESGGCLRSVHAEVNAIMRAPKRRFPKGSSMYCTYSPCAACTQAILNEPRITSVYYQIPYRINDHLNWLLKADVFVGRVTPNGMVIDERTKELVEP